MGYVLDPGVTGNISAGGQYDNLDTVDSVSYSNLAAESAAAAAESVLDAANASRLTIGTVTTGLPGTPAAATITGVAGNQNLNLVIPKGDTGAGGAKGNYGTFYGTNTQVSTVSNQPVQLTAMAEGSGMSLSSGTRMVITQPGTYKMTYSIQLANTDNAVHYADIWLKYNGTNYPNSNTRFYVPARKSAGEAGYTIATVDFIGTSVNVNDYVELYWVSDSNLVSIITIPSYDGVPSAPAVIANLSQVMYTQVGPQGPVGDVNPAMYTILADAQSARDSAISASNNASGYATNAGTQASYALTSANNAQASATSASNSAYTAANSAATSTNKANESSASASAASVSAANALTYKDNAATSANEAMISANSAANSASSANSSAGSASASSTNATNQAGTATTAANNAQASATAAANSATSAQSSATSAANSVASIGSSVTTAANSATAAASSASAANTSAGSASGSAASALAIYGSVTAQQTALANAQAAASQAQGYAASASSVVQQDLSAVSAGLHRSPNAVAAMYIYDTSKDSDGGAWTEKCQGTSWYNEALCGKWLGAQASEAYARYSGATLGSELVTNGTFDSGLTTGWSSAAAAASSAVVVNGELQITTSATNGKQITSVTTTSGKVYRATCTARFVSGSSAIGAAIYQTDSSGNTVTGGEITLSTTNTAISVIFTATAATSYISLMVIANSGAVGVFDNISVREVTALNTASNDYFQLTTDGKFYRLWKNLFGYSNDFSKSPWYTAATSVLSGSPGAQIITVNSGQTNTKPNGVSQVSTMTAGVPYVYSVEVGNTGARYALLSFDNGAGYLSQAYFDLQTGTVGGSASHPTPVSGWTASIAPGSQAGRYIISVAFTFLTGSNVFRVMGSTAVPTPSGYEYLITADGTTGLPIYGAQLEIGTARTAIESKTSADTTKTEVYRGNKAKFPKVAGIVAEATNVTIYDLTEPGRPMWMRLRNDGANSLLTNNNAGKSLASLNGRVLIGDAQYDVVELDFIKDSGYRYSLNTITGPYKGNLAARNAYLGWNQTGTLNIVNRAVNALAMTVLPDAPVDPVTGLKVPTIAVGTGGGLSVIKHDGVVANSTRPYGIYADGLSIANGYLLFGEGSNFSNPNVVKLSAITGTSFTPTLMAPNAGPEVSNYTQRLTYVGKNSFATPGSNLILPLRMFRSNYANGSKGATTRISNTYNTGHMVGDIRRAYLADVSAGGASGTELVTNGTFDTDTGGWSAVRNGSGSISWNSGQITVTNGGGDFAGIQQAIPTVVGKTYAFTFTSVAFAGGAINGRYRVGTTSAGGEVIISSTYAAGTYTFLFTALSATSYIQVDMNSLAVGATGTFDNISVKEVVADRSYKAQSAAITGTLTRTAVATAAQAVAYSGFSAANYLREPYSADLDFGTGEWNVGAWGSIPTGNATAGTIASRAHSTGAYITLGIDATSKLTATAYDGTTTRTVTTTAAYNTATWFKAEAEYTTDGTLAIKVNGQRVATTTGTPLLTLNNSNAVLTIGNSYALDAPFPGSIALLKLGATVPTAEQSVWMYEQEKQLFRDGAQCVLPDSGSIVDLTYDDATDRWMAISATNESYWNGLVRVATEPVSAGSYTKLAAGSGLHLVARSTTSPGVDVTIPAYGLREELVKKAEAAAKLTQTIIALDYVGGFTASTTNTSTAITSVAGISYPSTINLIGATVTGSGIPASTVITGISGTTIYLSKAATATATGVQISLTDFPLPVGYEARAVLSAGLIKTEGSTKDYTRLYDGFKETIRFGTAPGYTAAVQIQAVRSI